MAFSNTLQRPKHDYPGGKAGLGLSRADTDFRHSLRSRGYVFIALVLAYVLLASLFFFSQRQPPLSQLDEYRDIQQTQGALIAANRAVFEALAVLAFEPERTDDGPLAQILADLRQHHLALAERFPRQATRLTALGGEISYPMAGYEQHYLNHLRSQLAKSRFEIERLLATNRSRMTGLALEYRNRDDLLVIKSLVLGSLGLILIGTVTTLFFNRLKSDLLRLQQRTSEIIVGYRGEPLPVARRDEVGRLTDGINYLSEALKEREQALEIQRRRNSYREKMIAIDSLASGIAHEVGNPITCISGLAAEIENDARNRLSEQSREMIGQLQRYANGIIRISRDLSQLDVKNIDRSEWIDINQLLNAAVRLCHYDNRWSGIAIELDLDSRLPAWYASENQFKQVCMHVLENALDALQDRQDARLRLQTRLDTEHGIVISFEDNGNGVDEDKLQTIFEPFYSTKAVGGGTGLGLAICLAIVESFDGAIRAEQACGGGLRIVIELPLGNSAHPEIAA